MGKVLLLFGLSNQHGQIRRLGSTRTTSSIPSSAGASELVSLRNPPSHSHLLILRANPKKDQADMYPPQQMIE